MKIRDQQYIGMRCDAELLERIKKQADEEERTVTSLLRLAVKQYLTSKQAYVSSKLAG